MYAGQQKDDFLLSGCNSIPFRELEGSIVAISGSWLRTNWARESIGAMLAQRSGIFPGIPVWFGRRARARCRSGGDPVSARRAVWPAERPEPGCVDSRVLDFALNWKRHQRRKRLLTQTKGHVILDVFCYNSNLFRVGKRNFINLRAIFVDESSRWVFKRICRLFSERKY